MPSWFLAIFLAAGLGFQNIGQAGISPPAIVATEVRFPQASLPLRQALEFLNRSGNRVVDFRARQGMEVANPLLHLSVEPQPFWRAVDEVASQSRLRVAPFVERDGQTVVGLLAMDEANAEPAGKPQYVGPFRLMVHRVTATPAGTPGVPSRLNVAVQVAWEPKYRPLWLHVPVDGVALATTSGAFQTVPQLKTQAFRTADEAAVIVTVHLPPQSQTELPAVRLRMIAVTPPRMTPFAFPQPFPGQQLEQDRVACTLVKIEEHRPSRRAWFSLRLRYPEKSLDLESHQAWVMLANKLRLIPKIGGQALEYTTASAEIDIREREGIDIRHELDNLPEPLSAYRLEYLTPAPPEHFAIEAVFEKTPLPPFPNQIR